MQHPAQSYVLLDDALSPDGRSFLFEDPQRILCCTEPRDVEATLRDLAEAGAQGLYAAGFLAYELGYLLEPKLSGLLPEIDSKPLIWMGLFRRRESLNGDDVARFIDSRGGGDYRLEALRLSIDREDYLRAFAKVKDYIADGDAYQINLTFKYLFDFAGDPLALYRDLRRQQRAGYGAVISAPGFHVLSLSPELFLECADGEASARPMKGTAPRGRTPDEDDELRAWLCEDPKSRAENLMIVDLLRNDLGRVAEIGSVRVTSLFDVERYPTVHQMTSGITARLRPGTGIGELLQGLFPCGSVTGAPKIRAMEIIRDLEGGPRGVYCGAIGMIEPNGDACLNVAIRTLLIDDHGRGEMGIGSGLVQDSDGAAEYEECLLKGRFLTSPDRPFQLIETLRWQDGYYLLDLHLERLQASSARFHFACDPAALREALESEARRFAGGVHRVRLLLDEDGRHEITATEIELPAADSVQRFVLSDRRIDSADVFFYHKTTNRALYDEEFQRLSQVTGCDEVLFLNERGEVCEGSRSNVFIERDGWLLTPPLSSGLLAGTLRRHLLAAPGGKVREAVLRPQDLEAAERIYFGNSVRGLVRAERLAVPLSEAAKAM